MMDGFSESIIIAGGGLFLDARFSESRLREVKNTTLFLYTRAAAAMPSPRIGLPTPWCTARYFK